MLVLSRKCGEKIVIPSLNVTLAILEVRGDRVRLGVSAPADLAVHRLEFWQRLHELEAAIAGAEPRRGAPERGPP